MPLDPNVAGLLAVLANSGRPPLHEGTPADARAGMRALLVNFRDETQLADVASVTPSTVGDQPARVYRPHADGALPTIVYLHGGGFVIGDLDTHEGVCRQLCADTGAVVVSVDYPLAPEHRFPAAVDGAYAALTDVRARIAEFGGDVDRLVVAGDSAGGNLAAVCALQARDDGVPLAAQLLVYPSVDMGPGGEYSSRGDNADGYFLTMEDMRWFGEHYTGATDRESAAALAEDPRLSPLRAPSLAGLAPAVVVTAEFDPLRDEGNRYAELLADAGVPVRHKQFAGLIHGFYGMELISPAIAAATAWINGALTDLLGSSADA